MVGPMPAAEVEADVDLVRALVESQRPDLAHLHIAPLANGWDNFSFRLGDELVARLPRRELAAPLIANEARWLPELAPDLPFPIPAPTFVGEPSDRYPWHWAICPLLPGSPVGRGIGLDLDHAASSLGRFSKALHRPAPAEAPVNPFRGVPLAERADVVSERIDLLPDVARASRASAVWEEALSRTVFGGESVWLHGDLHPNNLLAEDGRITGVIDWGDVTSGDPATDLAVAWMLFPADLRARFRAECGHDDDDTWARARGWALALALAYVFHSADNPTMGEIGETTMRRVLEEA